MHTRIPASNPENSPVYFCNALGPQPSDFRCGPSPSLFPSHSEATNDHPSPSLPLQAVVWTTVQPPAITVMDFVTFVLSSHVSMRVKVFFCVYGCVRACWCMPVREFGAGLRSLHRANMEQGCGASTRGKKKQSGRRRATLHTFHPQGSQG